MDASLFKPQRNLDSLASQGISFIKEVRVNVTGSIDDTNNLQINNNKVLLTLWDNANSEDLYVTKEDLNKKLRNILAENNLAHLILILSHKPQDGLFIIADSLVQVGWIKNK